MEGVRYTPLPVYDSGSKPLEVVGGANIKYIKDMGITIKKIVESFIDTIKSIRTSSENHDQKTNGSTKSFFRKDNEDVATSLFALKTYQSSGD